MGNAVISANEGARPCALETQIKRYHRSYRRRLRKLVRHSSRLGDLAYTFPAAAFALVSGRATPDRRGEAVRMVIDGRSLKDVAAILDLATLDPPPAAGSLLPSPWGAPGRCPLRPQGRKPRPG